MARSKPKATVTVKRTPVKVGSTNRGGNGGLMTAKVIKIRKKLKK